ncbi:uncharacterized protein [Drosophila takahashii]|uniref:uncharacterized protein n=1 Tax=Drosophila takahashii TaxID=29030 RepID=UPI001CF92C27|nr:uncharacterized protein LOC108055214 [Drosophila takahashii]
MSQQNTPKINNDEQSMRCLQCMKVVRCSRYDTGGLLRHIELDHPDLFAVASARVKNIHKLGSLESAVVVNGGSKLSSLTDSDSECIKLKRRFSGEKATRKVPTACPVSQDHVCQKTKKQTCPKTLQKNQIYPKIKAQSSPKSRNPSCSCSEDEAKLFRKMSFKVSVNKWCHADGGSIFCPACGHKRRPVIKSAAELYSGWCSWAKCLFPCLAPPDDGEYLFCSRCNTFLGIHIKAARKFKPNKEYS